MRRQLHHLQLECKVSMELCISAPAEKHKLNEILSYFIENVIFSIC